MTLTPDQSAAVQQWADAGATLNDIQQQLKQDFAVSITYLEARLLMLELKVQIKDKPKEVPKVEEPAPAPVANEQADDSASAEGGAVTLTVDELAIPGALASGSVTFTDGKTAGWYLDQSGRLGMRAPEPGYQPPAADIPVFQEKLDQALVAAGF